MDGPQKTQASGSVNLRDQMPHTARWMNLVRQQLGKDHVNGMVRRALAGERNCFYAIEGGHVVGTPFDWTLQGQMLVSMSALTGEPFVAAVRERDGGMVMGRAGGVGDGTH